MSSNVFCPISFNKIDENVARLNGAFTVLLLLASVLTTSVLPVLFLVVDFLARSISKPEYSLLAIFSKVIVKSLGIKPRKVNAGPKIFAARIGLVFSVFVALFSILALENISLVFLAVFGACAFLEAVFGYCVACKIYPIFYKLFQASSPAKIKKFGFQDFEI